MQFKSLIARNKGWAIRRAANDATFFGKLASGQAPPVLWIGCADSRVPPDTIVEADPGTLFVHRNVANMVAPGDLNLMSVLQYAVDVLKVQHVVVCGHHSCGGVGAIVDGLSTGLLGHWLAPVAQVAAENARELAALPHREARVDRLVELNVRSQILRLAQSPVVRTAWERGQRLELHGLVFDLSTGLLQDLDCSLQASPGYEQAAPAM